MQFCCQGHVIYNVVTTVLIPIGVIAAGLALTTYYSVVLQYIPINDIKQKFDTKGIVGVFNREGNIQIPLRNALEPYISNITLFIYSKPSNIELQGVKLSTSSNTILSYQGNFLPCQRSNISATTANCFEMLAYVQHNLVVSNSTDPFTIDIFYMNRTDDSMKFDSISIPFTWSIKTLDMSLLSLFLDSHDRGDC